MSVKSLEAMSEQEIATWLEAHPEETVRPDLSRLPFAVETVPVMADGRVVLYVPMRPVVGTMCLDWTGQRQRILRDPILKDCVAVVSTQGRGDLFCLELWALPGWLLGISLTKLAPDVEARVKGFQSEALRVLAQRVPVPRFDEPAAAVEPSPTPSLSPGWLNPRPYEVKNGDEDLVGAFTLSYKDFDPVYLALGVIERAAASIKSPKGRLNFLWKASSAAEDCQTPTLGPNSEQRDLTEHASLISLILDTGIALHPQEIEALTSVSDISLVLDRMKEDGSPAMKRGDGLYVKST